MRLIDKEYVQKRLLDAKMEKNRAKQIILQILKEAGGSLGKTKLFKVFWIAHLFYSKTSAGYLSSWKIVRMPHGPGIDKGDSLIIELKNSGKIYLDHEPKGPFTETVCRLVGKAKATRLPDGAAKAIRDAYEIVKDDTAAKISEWSHEFSRSWNNTPNGKELDIYSDLIPDDVYEERRAKLEKLNEVYDDLFT